MKPTFEPLSQEHLDDVVEIEKLSFKTPWTKYAFLHEIEFHGSVFEIAKIDGRLAGYGGFWLIMDEAHLSNVAIHPDHRRKGLGRMLLVRLLEQAIARGAARATLEVRRSNEAGLSLYGSFGFEVIGVRKNYYSDENEDALVMWNEDLAATLNAKKKEGEAES